MMKSAYNERWIYNLQVIKQAKLWVKNNLIKQDQFIAISEAYKTPLFHPNYAIRILLFIATVIAAFGVIGLAALFFDHADETAIGIISFLFGVAAFVILEQVFIGKGHYKSGVTEGVAYLACGFTIGGIAAIVDFDNIILIQIVSLLVLAFAAARYLDLLLTLTFIVIFSWTIFYHCYEAEGIFRSIIPFVFIITFSGLYFIVRKFKKQGGLKLWRDNLMILEVCCLALVYAGGNYLVVRELSVNLMEIELQPVDDIPFAFLFYFFTVAIPIIILWAGIKTKDKILLRISLIALMFSAFTFKYYYIQGHSEITLMIGGAISIILAIWLMRHLNVRRSGFTSENILSSSWANLNVEAFIISQTVGGNQPEKIEIHETGGGGQTGGGGASSTF